MSQDREGSGAGEVKLREYVTEKMGEPVLVDMKPQMNTTDCFYYTFKVCVKGSPARAKKIVADRMAELIQTLPEELQDAMLHSYQELSAATLNAKDYERKVQTENRRLMEAVDAQDQINADLRAATEKAEAEAKALRAQREGWRARIDGLVINRAREMTRGLQAELREEQRRSATVRSELARLKEAIRVIGGVFSGGDRG